MESSTAESDLEVLVAGKLNMSQQCVLGVKRASCISGCIAHTIASLSREIIVLYDCTVVASPQVLQAVLGSTI